MTQKLLSNHEATYSRHAMGSGLRSTRSEESSTDTSSINSHTSDDCLDEEGGMGENCG